MWLADGWVDAGEEAIERRRLAVTLAASILLHLFVLTAIKLPPKDRSGAGHPVLTVVLKTLTVATSPAPVTRFNADVPEPLPTPQALPPPRLLVRDALRPAKPVIAEPQPPVPEKSAVARTLESARVAAPLPMAKAVESAKPPAPGRDARTAPVSGGVSVLMTIGEGGRIDQIFWKTLPALTNEQFQRLESMLRANRYAESQAGTTVTEIVDVRGLLGLPPASGGSARASPP